MDAFDAATGKAAPLEAVAFDKLPQAVSKAIRTLVKEPIYKNKPKYCLVLFGMTGRTRLWLVQDGDTLYVDKNDNRDLTDPGERRAITEPEGGLIGPHHPYYEVGEITEVGGKRDFRFITSPVP